MSDPIRDTMIEFDDSLWAMAAEINRQRAEIARLTATLDGDPHQTATPEQRRAWRSSAIKYADRLETEVARLTAELAAANEDAERLASSLENDAYPFPIRRSIDEKDAALRAHRARVGGGE
jgi:hypothetical protein